VGVREEGLRGRSKCMQGRVYKEAIWQFFVYSRHAGGANG
jgi:hypothetical protein